MKPISNPFTDDTALRLAGFEPETMGGGEVLWTRHYPDGFHAIGRQANPAGYVASMHETDGANVWQWLCPSVPTAIAFLDMESVEP